MKFCPKCGAQTDDGAMFCNNCGFSFQQQTQQPNNFNQAQGNPAPNGAPIPNVQPYVDPYDHTSEFSVEDVRENKLYAILVYITSIVGIVIALLAKKSCKSPYLDFHIKQALKIFICEGIVAFITVVLCWTCIVPFAGAVSEIILLVVTIICFVKTCQNKSVEPQIIRNFGFLK